MRKQKRGKGHSYTDWEWSVEDQCWVKIKIDGVTTLISEGLPKPALINWAANTTADYAVDHWHALASEPVSERIKKLKAARFSQRDAAARRGTEVHRLAETLLQGQEVDVPDELAGHVDAYVKFLDEWQPRPVLVESVVGSRRWSYGGTLDMVVDLPDGRRMIADIKTSRSGIYPEAAYQLAAYANAEFYLDANDAEQPMADLGIHGALGIWVRADGYDVHPIDISDPTFETFLYIARVARDARENKELIGDATRPEVSA